MQAGGHRFEPVHLHHPEAASGGTTGVWRRFGEIAVRSHPARRALFEEGEERVCHVTEADRLGPQGPLSAKRSFACRVAQAKLAPGISERSVFM